MFPRVGQRYILKVDKDLYKPSQHEVVDIDFVNDIVVLKDCEYGWIRNPITTAVLLSDYILVDSDGVPNKDYCWHEYKEYIGFTEAYEFCTKCGEKKWGSKE